MKLFHGFSQYFYVQNDLQERGCFICKI